MTNTHICVHNYGQLLVKLILILIFKKDVAAIFIFSMADATSSHISKTILRDVTIQLIARNLQIDCIYFLFS